MMLPTLPNTFSTPRLALDPLTAGDGPFIRALVNTDGWLRFIGDRNVDTDENALAYIQKILDNPNVTYRVVRIKDTATPIGIVTVIQRDYLPHPDIGFAFLPAHAGKGYAYEAAKVVLDALQANSSAPVLATTIPENTRSIQLLQKLGLQQERTIHRDGETLLVFTT